MLLSEHHRSFSSDAAMFAAGKAVGASSRINSPQASSSAGPCDWEGEAARACGPFPLVAIDADRLAALRSSGPPAAAPIGEDPRLRGHPRLRPESLRCSTRSQLGAAPASRAQNQCRKQAVAATLADLSTTGTTMAIAKARGGTGRRRVSPSPCQSGPPGRTIWLRRPCPRNPSARSADAY